MPSSYSLTIDAGSGLASGMPSFVTQNDNCSFRLRITETENAQLVDSKLSSPSFKMAFGIVNAVPAMGQFKLSTTTGTSSAIAYNATTSDVATAVSAVAGAVSVVTYGDSKSAWLVTAATVNTALSFSGITFTLFPTSTPRVTTLQAPASGVTAVQLIELVRQSAVSAVTFTSATTANVVTMSKIQSGSATGNTTYKLALGGDAVSGSYSLIYGNNATTAISLFATSASVQTALSAVTGLGANIAVLPLGIGSGHLISFVNALALTNVTTTLSIDSVGVQYASYYEGSITFSGLDLGQMFAESQKSTCTGLLEIEMTESGKRKTIFQSQISVRKDLQS
jgi:hypothetical protein